MQTDDLPLDQFTTKLGNTFIAKKVSVQHINQFNDLLRYVFQVTNQVLSEVGWEALEMVQEKAPILKNAQVLGWFDGDKLVSQVAVYPLQVNIHGETFSMGGVTGVGTYPEYSGFGLAKGIMLKSLEEMRERGQTISYLYPYSVPYYRKKGWEIVSDVMSFTIKDTQIPPKVEVGGLVQRFSQDHIHVKEVYNKYASNHHGALIRGDLEWGEYFRWDKDDMVAAIYYDENNTPQGFLLYFIENDVFNAKEMIYLTQEARHGLWNFIGAHFSMVDLVKGKTYKNEPIAFLLEDSEIEETIKPYIMARIVDVMGFLRKYPFKESCPNLSFVVSDPLLDWNRGSFSLKFSQEGQHVSTEKDGYEIELDINTLTTMLMSYKRPRYLQKIGKIKAEEKAINYLEKIIPSETAYFSDYF
ncbi:MAG: GNAT family N-acetyltransferase [Defluviitaleaceae bacterium]|nr:GNAT family N-acetyltransferase [Defluviitaleaceae bacterium]